MIKNIIFINICIYLYIYIFVLYKQVIKKDRIHFKMTLYFLYNIFFIIIFFDFK